jgi:hypothetical protein
VVFYAHRYLGISYQRAQDRDLKKAKFQFDRADVIANSFATTSQVHRELKARILGNLGNCALDARDFALSLKLHNRSLTLFEAIEDREHVGIEHLHIAKAVVERGGRGLDETLPHLHEAELIAVRLGWVEGLGRVAEQRAKYHLVMSDRETDETSRQRHLREAERAAEKGRATFEAIGLPHLGGRIESLLENIASKIASARTKRNAVRVALR